MISSFILRRGIRNSRSILMTIQNTTPPIRTVLFLCTGNSCRPQITEAIVNQKMGDSWQAFSSGNKTNRVCASPGNPCFARNRDQPPREIKKYLPVYRSGFRPRCHRVRFSPRRLPAVACVQIRKNIWHSMTRLHLTVMSKPGSTNFVRCEMR